MKKIFTFFLFSIIFLFNTNNSFSIEPDVFIQSTVNRATDTLSSNLTKEERILELKQIAQDTVDITGIGFYSLGSHRKNLSKEQLLAYKNAFEEYFLKSFSSRLAEYSNPENLLIRDLIIEGLSLARTQKEEFSSIINSNNGEIEALLKN